MKERRRISLIVCFFAGSEWDYVILSTVRSLPRNEIDPNPIQKWRSKHLGFITDEHQINVALTRSKNGLIITGLLSLIYHNLI